VVHHLADLISWLEPHALLLALALPPVIRIVGHWIPEELFMVSMGVLASRAGSPQIAVSILGAVILSQFVTDQTVYLVGRYLRPRLRRFPRVERRISVVTERLSGSPSALLGFIPARVLPLGRGAWLVGCGVVRVPWPRFVCIDIAALAIHLAVWSGLGWWLAGDLQLLARSSEMGKLAGTWLAIALICSIMVVILWRHREGWQPATVRAMRRAGRSLRGLGRAV
jgi:membrane protein DedA with SNARE-associated domain